MDSHSTLYARPLVQVEKASVGSGEELIGLDVLTIQPRVENCELPAESSRRSTPLPAPFHTLRCETSARPHFALRSVGMLCGQPRFDTQSSWKCGTIRT